MYLSKNLRYLREQNGKQSQGKLAEAMGVTRSAISSYEDGRAEPKLELLNKLADYFNITVDQLINVELVKLGQAEAQKKEEMKNYISGKHFRVLTITLNEDENENVELIPEKAAAGYTTGYADETYLAELPKYKLPFLSRGKTYRAFEISGDSMLPLQPNSIVIGEYVMDWNDLKDGQVCVIVSRSEGIVLKKLFSKVKDRGSFLLKSSNLNYPPYEIAAGEVIEIWKFAAYISKNFPDESGTSVQDLKEAFWRLEDDIRELKTHQSN
ncbi:helix-turn-helix domain-containing protein [Rapidithrix thailandica]|uniref:Helix-turn-helix domain-containing protein n=1 Tax=Rapidithrix thailandica TaxID=413964 RepID=A0AAW9SAD1_9BACT